MDDWPVRFEHSEGIVGIHNGSDTQGSSREETESWDKLTFSDCERRCTSGSRKRMEPAARLARLRRDNNRPVRPSREQIKGIRKHYTNRKAHRHPVMR